MYIVKVRDSLRPFAPAASSRIAMLDLGAWKTCILSYPTAEQARQFIARQKSRPSREPELVRDYRIFEKDGRKLTLIEEIKGE